MDNCGNCKKYNLQLIKVYDELWNYLESSYPKYSDETMDALQMEIIFALDTYNNEENIDEVGFREAVVSLALQKGIKIPLYPEQSRIGKRGYCRNGYNKTEKWYKERERRYSGTRKKESD